jgi:hypothetical protein
VVCIPQSSACDTFGKWSLVARVEGAIRSLGVCPCIEYWEPSPFPSLLPGIFCSTCSHHSVLRLATGPRPLGPNDWIETIRQNKLFLLVSFWPLYFVTVIGSWLTQKLYAPILNQAFS